MNNQKHLHWLAYYNAASLEISSRKKQKKASLLRGHPNAFLSEPSFLNFEALLLFRDQLLLVPETLNLELLALCALVNVLDVI